MSTSSLIKKLRKQAGQRALTLNPPAASGDRMSKPYAAAAFVGHYTRDTIISAQGTRLVDGGALNYGAQVAARMGLRVAAITRLAAEDAAVVSELSRLGVDVFARTTPRSTCLRLEYPSSNLDERVIHVTGTAWTFTPAEVAGVQARVSVIGASMRGEVGLDVIEELASMDTEIAVDVQGFVRVNRGGLLGYDEWPEQDAILSHVAVLKTDAVEAEVLTGHGEIHRAARSLAYRGVREIVLTHRDGLLVYAGGEFHEGRFYPRQLVGRSGRGDTCLAAYVSKKLASPAAEATTWAAAVTSLKMEDEGPFRRSIDDVEELIRRQYG